MAFMSLRMIHSICSVAHKTTARWYIWIYSFRLVFPNFPLGFLLLKVHTKAHWLLKAALGGTLEKWSKKNQSQQTAARQRLRKTVIARRENKLNPFTIKKCLLGHLLFHFVQCCLLLPVPLPVISTRRLLPQKWRQIHYFWRTFYMPEIKATKPIFSK